MTSVPGALSALVEKTKLKLPGVQVFDGPPTEDPDPDIVMIGWSPTALGVEMTNEPAGLDSDQETYDINCIASSWSGDLDIVTRRARAFELVNAVVDVCAENTRLGGAVARTRVTLASIDQNVAQEGMDVTIGFVVHVNAFRP